MSLAVRSILFTIKLHFNDPEIVVPLNLGRVLYGEFKGPTTPYTLCTWIIIPCSFCIRKIYGLKLNHLLLLCHNLCGRAGHR